MSGRQRPPRPTMKDVAAQVGVSIKTVSRVLNGEPGSSAATAERIVTVAHELGYRRNDLARNLRRRDGAETIGVVAKHLSTRLFEGLIRGIEDVTADHDALVLTAAAQSAEREQSTLLALSSRRVDGLVIIPSGHDQSFLRSEQTAGLPMVFVDRPPSGITADTVIADNKGGGQVATRHLIQHGHRRIAVVGPSARRYTVEERVAGYRCALEGVASPDEHLIRLDCSTTTAASIATQELLALPEPPTAIFGLSSICAIGVARALRQASVGHDIALIGFDDFEPADLLDPPLSVIAQDPVATGRQAATTLFRRIQGDTSPAHTTMLPTYLIPRGSGEIAPPQPTWCFDPLPPEEPDRASPAADYDSIAGDAAS